VIGSRVTHYQVLRNLGAGGMGIVYEAQDLRLGRKVALKFLPETAGLDPEAVKRFMREARAASAINHPNICTIYEVHEADEVVAHVVERVAAGCARTAALAPEIDREDLEVPGEQRHG